MKDARQSQEFWTRWFGPMAFWGGVTMGPSRTSMMFPSHGAVEGMLRRVLGKWEIRWLVHEVRLLTFSHTVSVASNEIKSFTGIKPVNVDGRTTQRNTVYLAGVSYAVRASMVLSKFADPHDDPMRKFEEMFMRRASMGQFHDRKPCFGTSECPVNYQLYIPGVEVGEGIDRSEDYGLVYFDRDWASLEQLLYYAPMKSEHGVVHYPSWDEVRKLGICRSIEEAKKAS